MKLFIDSANLSEIREIHRLGILDGVTTNPSLIAKESKKESIDTDYFHSVIIEIAELVDGPVSAEVISTDTESMIREAMDLSKLHRNVVVKIPLIEEGIRAVSLLSREGISTNVTLCFSATQALLAAKVGASYISPFIGRLDDSGQKGMTLIEEIMTIYQNFNMDTQIIAASMRSPMHVLESAMLGSDIVTAPYGVLKALFKHPLTDKGLSNFLKDWKGKENEVQNILKK